MRIPSRKLSQRIINASFAFVLALSTVTASMPFVFSQTASAATNNNGLFTVDTVCSNEKAELNLKLKQSGLLTGSILYETPYGNNGNQTLDFGDTDVWLGVKTNLVSAPSVSVSAKVGFWLFGHFVTLKTYSIMTDAKNCDTTAPTATVSYVSSTPTNESVIATIIANETIQDMAGWDRVDGMTIKKTYDVNTTENIIVTDMAGNSSAVTVDITWIDTSKPVVVYVSPASNGAILSAVTGSLKVDFSDETNLQQVTVHGYFNGNPVSQLWVHPIVSGKTKTLELPLVGLGEGAYEIRAAATDTAGNRTQINRTLVIDNTRPQTTLIAPVSGEINKGNFTISGTAQDANGIEKVLIYVGKRDNNNMFKGYVVNGEEAVLDGTAFTYNITNLPEFDGTYYVRAFAYDPAGNNHSDGADSIIVDTTAPEVAITSPSVNLTNNNVGVRATITDENLRHYWVQIKKNGTVIYNKTVESDSINNELLYVLTENGKYTITVAARDKAGGTADSGNRSADVVKTVTIDKSAPVIDITNVNITTDKYLSFDLLATDNGLAGLQVVAANIYDESNTTKLIELGSGNPSRLNTPYNGLPIGTSTFSTSLDKIDISSLPTGTYTIRAYAKDHAGNELRFKLVQFTVDNTAPVLEILSAVRNADGTYTVNGATDDSADVEVSVNGTVWGIITPSVDGTWGVVTDVLADGNHTITAKSTDAAGNEGDAVYDFVAVTPVVDDENETSDQSNDDEQSNSGNDDENSQDGAPVDGDDEGVEGQGEENGETPEEEIAGESDDKSDDILGTSTDKDGTWNIIGLAWYWWIAILAALAALARLLVVLKKRRNGEA